jgi:hypothetical protein
LGCGCFKATQNFEEGFSRAIETFFGVDIHEMAEVAAPIIAECAGCAVQFLSPLLQANFEFDLTKLSL